jgi:hypothetical protein
MLHRNIVMCPTRDQCLALGEIVIMAAMRYVIARLSGSPGTC